MVTTEISSISNEINKISKFQKLELQNYNLDHVPFSSANLVIRSH